MKKLFTNLKVFMTLCLLLVSFGNAWGAEGDLLCGGSFIGSFPNSESWTGSDVDYYSGNGYKFDMNETLQSPDLKAGVKKVTIKILVGHNGGATSTLKVGAYNSSDELLAETENIVPTVAYDKQTDAAIQEFTLDGGTTDIKYIKLSFTKVKNYGMKTLEVYDASGTPTKTLTSIAISGAPDKTTYEAGEEFDPTGLTVTGTYDDATTDEITSGIEWAVSPSGTLTAGTSSVSVTATVSKITSEAYTVNGLTVNAATPKITIDGTASGITTTDGSQSVTVGGVEFGGIFKQYTTTALWLTSGTGYIYNKESFGKIKKITINYKSGGSASAYQYIRLGTTILGTYSETSTNGIEYTTSTGGSSNTFTVTGDYEYFCISVSNKNLQASSIEIEYEETAPDNREMPTASFENETVNAVVDDDFTITVSTNSDGTVTYSSSDEDIAMVDSSTGEVHAISAGTATITADIAGTTTYKPTSASYTIVIASAPLMGKGTEAEPYTVGDIITLGSNGNECWVGGTIVGFGVSEKQLDDSYKLNYTTDTEKFAPSNLVISDGNGKIAAVELPSGTKIRTALNLPEHLNYIGAPIKVYGKLTTYFNQVGVKSTSDYKLTQQDVEITDAGWATAYVPFAATVAGATAYYVTVEGSSAKLHEIEGTIPANTGVVLKGAAGTAKFTESAVDPTTDFAENVLEGVLTDTQAGDLEVTSGNSAYVLNSVGGQVGFYPLKETGTLAANRAYMEVPDGAAVKAFFFDEEATGIQNSQFTIHNGDVMYNLNGQVVGKDYKGIVIVNGKKMLNK